MKAKKQAMITQEAPRTHPMVDRHGYIQPAHVAQLLRVELRRAFPGVAFSVKTSKYSGGSTITVTWTDGPTAKTVEEVTHHYEGKGFDGMIDMAYSKGQWLLPDGRLRRRDVQGTAASGGAVSKVKFEQPDPRAIAVQTTNYVHTVRKVSEGLLRRAIAEAAARYRDFDPSTVTVVNGEVRDTVAPAARIGNDWAINYVWSMAREMVG